MRGAGKLGAVDAPEAIKTVTVEGPSVMLAPANEDGGERHRGDGHRCEHEHMDDFWPPSVVLSWKAHPATKRWQTWPRRSWGGASGPGRPPWRVAAGGTLRALLGNFAADLERFPQISGWPGDVPESGDLNAYSRECLGPMRSEVAFSRG